MEVMNIIIFGQNENAVTNNETENAVLLIRSSSKSLEKISEIAIEAGYLNCTSQIITQ